MNEKKPEVNIDEGVVLMLMFSPSAVVVGRTSDIPADKVVELLEWAARLVRDGVAIFESPAKAPSLPN